MARKPDAQEPLLTAVARTLGHAAGTLVNMAQKRTTEQINPESRSPSQPESVEPEPVNQTKSPASVRQNRSTKLGQAATPKKRTTKSRKAPDGNTIATKRGSTKKR
jgi:hypothetical protein